MKVLVTIAWRNIWRNRLRTAIVLLTVATGLSGGLFAMAFSKGFSQQLVQEVTDIETPQIGFLPKDASAFTSTASLIPDAVSLADSLSASPGIYASARLHVQVVLSSARASNNVTLTGVFPHAEQEISSLPSRIAPDSGNYLDPSQESPIVIGRQLAVELNVQVSNRIVATFQGFDGEVVSMVFYVAGIFDYQNTSFERLNAYVLFEELAEWSGADVGAASEIGLKLADGLPAIPRLKEKLQAALPEMTVVGWDDQRPEIAFMYYYIDLINALIIAVILMALSLGVVNIMLMVINERSVELGVLRAIGLKNHKVVIMVVLETLFLMVLGTALSLVITAGLMSWFGHAGLDLSVYLNEQVGHGYAYQNNYNVVSIIYPVFTLKAFFHLSLLVIATGLVSSWLPCKRALKIRPAEAVNAAL
jgi:putative ABC transport system permease protein